MKFILTKKAYPVCPEYKGPAKIVDMTQIATVETKFGEKEMFRFILEINQKDEDGRYHTCATSRMTPTLDERSNLRKFIEKVIGEPLDEKTLRVTGFESDDLIGAYCEVIIGHTKKEDGTIYANIEYVGHLKAVPEKWTSDYARQEDR